MRLRIVRTARTQLTRHNSDISNSKIELFKQPGDRRRHKNKPQVQTVHLGLCALMISVISPRLCRGLSYLQLDRTKKPSAKPASCMRD